MEILKKKRLIFLLVFMLILLSSFLIKIAPSINASLFSPVDFHSKWKIVGSSTIKSLGVVSSQFSEQRKDVLLHYLVRDASWHVTKLWGSMPDEQELVAFKRSKIDNKWITVNKNGFIYYEFSEDLQQSRTLFRLEGIAIHPWYPGYYTLAKTDTPSVKIKLYIRDRGNPIESYLVLKNKNGLNIEIYEESHKSARKFTQTALKEIGIELSKLVKENHAGTIGETGNAHSLLTAGSIKLTQNSEISITDIAERGNFIVSGYLNSGEEGFIYLRVLDADSNSEIVSLDEKNGTVEYIGWSNNFLEKFYFNIRVLCASSKRSFPADFQVWFHPKNNSSERMLVSQRKVIDGWTR